MITKRIFIALIFIVLLSCYSKKQKEIKYDVPKMEAILKDIVGLQIKNDTALADIKNKDSVYAVQMKSILKKHQMSDSDFKYQYDYFLNHTEQIIQTVKNIQEKK